MPLTDNFIAWKINNTDNGFSRLEFTSFSSQYWGVYSCVSDEQYNNVYITNGELIEIPYTTTNSNYY